ncbi:cytochrome c3 family protein [Nitrogeniibacter aestuarii]|uniref:cytochrome c3 family protein n=1 Tax=Nitrogeniibacter aestuarii TaxID=2815343 RepID=UPI001E3476D2|nr:cytochrome c3 family protein [Nitrogeniibacter aestuarii]
MSWPLICRRAIALSGRGVLILLVANALALDLRDTPHNLARRTGATPPGVDALCIYCHTPIASSADGGPPRWQPSVPEAHRYDMFDDIGRLGLSDSTAVGSQSLACLSCHDAVQAFEVSPLGYDHPFGVPYRGGLTETARQQALDSALLSGTPLKLAEQLKFPDDFRPAHRALVDNRPVWWASRHDQSDRRQRDDLPLFVRTDGPDGAEVPFIECASCHNPHSTNPVFLRGSPTDGGLCLTCHVK